jgi:signal transduction histidine kinase
VLQRINRLLGRHRIGTLMTLSRFITDNMEEIVQEWQAFAMTMEPAASTMSVLALRDHAKPILLAIAKDLESTQSAAAQEDKSKRLSLPLSARETAAATHGALRHVSGFDLNQLGAEYRALRASVIRLWTRKYAGGQQPGALDDVIRFNEAVDQAVAESTARYAAELSLSRATFLAIMAHDLRSPLSAITMLSYMLEKNAGSDQERKQAGQILRSAKEMGGMIRDLLEYTRTQLGKGLPTSVAATSVFRVCAEAMEEVRAAYPAREFLLDVAENLTGMIDSARLKQALSNLLNNAVQHGDPHSRIAMTGRVEDTSIVIQVINRGEVIPAESLQVIFDPLVQLSEDSAVKATGTSTSLGLGLFITREVALGHGGSIDVTSNEQDGTTFTLRLPVS